MCLTFPCSPWSLLDPLRCDCSERMMSSPSAPRADGFPGSNDPNSSWRGPALFFQVNGRRLTHGSSELTKLRVHLFHLFLQMILIDGPHLLRILRMQQSLCEFETGSYIGFG